MVTNATGPDLIDLLTAWQRELGLSDERFGALLGYSQSGWYRVRMRQRRHKLAMAQAAIAVWPERRAAIMEATFRQTRAEGAA